VPRNWERGRRKPASKPAAKGYACFNGSLFRIKFDLACKRMLEKRGYYEIMLKLSSSEND